MATRATRPTLRPSEETCVHLRGRIRKKTRGEDEQRSQWWQMAGQGLCLLPPSLSLSHWIRDAMCNIWEGEGFMQESSFSIVALFHKPLHLHWCFTGEIVFLLNITFSRDRGGQRCNQKGFIHPCVPTDARLSPQKRTSTRSPADTSAVHLLQKQSSQGFKGKLGGLIETHSPIKWGKAQNL